MKKLFVSLMVVASALSMVVSEAQAKRLGGGGSVGRQSQSVSRQVPAQNQATNMAKPAAPVVAPQAALPKPASPWKGILGGALLGLGLGALMSHFGLGGAMAGMMGSLLMVALLAVAAMFIYRMLTRNKNGTSVMQPAFANGPAAAMPEIGSRIEPAQPVALQNAGSGATATPTLEYAPWGVPADFDTDGFLRHAKTCFIRLQAAWDKADINDLREFTTPEMFAEMRMQLQERGASANHTDVVSLDAELLGLEIIGSDHLASVKFSGMIKESEHAAAAAFTEVWNISKPLSGNGGWTLAGIQQSA